MKEVYISWYVRYWIRNAIFSSSIHHIWNDLYSLNTPKFKIIYVLTIKTNHLPFLMIYKDDQTRDSNTHSKLQLISWSLSSELSKMFKGSLHFSIEFDSWLYILSKIYLNFLLETHIKLGVLIFFLYLQPIF